MKQKEQQCSMYIRVPSLLHKSVKRRAQEAGLSINKWAVRRLIECTGYTPEVPQANNNWYSGSLTFSLQAAPNAMASATSASIRIVALRLLNQKLP
jgi:hypothetical protein